MSPICKEKIDNLCSIFWKKKFLVVVEREIEGERCAPPQIFLLGPFFYVPVRCIFRFANAII